MFLTLQNAIKNFAILAWSVEQHTPFGAHHMFSVARRIEVVFRILLLRCFFLRFFIQFTDIDGTVTALNRFPSKSPLLLRS